MDASTPPAADSAQATPAVPDPTGPQAAAPAAVATAVEVPVPVAEMAANAGVCRTCHQPFARPPGDNPSSEAHFRCENCRGSLMHLSTWINSCTVT